MRLLSLKDMEPLARDAVRLALIEAGVTLTEQEKEHLTLGSHLDDHYGTFELCIAGETPLDAKVVVSASVDRTTGQVEVQIKDFRT